jgi:hypothetical protein
MSAFISLVETEAEDNTFIPGAELSAAFYREILRPLLLEHFPELPHAAALLGEGSDVLGFDNETSMDHNWGPRGILFLSPEDHPHYRPLIDALLRKHLPYTFRGFPTSFTLPQRSYLVQQMEYLAEGEVNHLMKIMTVPELCQYYLGHDMTEPLTVQDWLTFPQQALCEVTVGPVYYDGLGELSRVRRELEYYPHQVWLYLMLCQWVRIANELSYQARTGQVDDEIGSRIICARTVEEIVKMSFFLSRRYMPYSKWRGSAFLELPIARDLSPQLLRALSSDSWTERQQCLGRAYQILGAHHNSLGLTEEVPLELSSFHGRGYTVLDVGPFIHRLQATIEHPQLKKMKYTIGGVDQFINHARINHENYLHRELKSLIR